MDDRSRFHDSLETALKLSDGLAILLTNDSETLFSSNYACKVCGFSVPKLEPKIFSFNAPFGACPECKGLGIYTESRSIFVDSGRYQINCPRRHSLL